ncbi:hypothetical protein [Planctomycetes bacterium K23_9]|uniref:F5/8 type C domain protein n=1 Tax=Stieleria marina TaxID=1930275 RepID=A0A517NWR2_9BACT|nr:hypothetical protein K239x_35750 [Planctomycetes bacterium K23_9]
MFQFVTNCDRSCRLCCFALVLMMMPFAVGESAVGQSVRVSLETPNVLEANDDPSATLRFENVSDQAMSAAVSYTLQLNSSLVEMTKPHPTLGYDHAIGAKSTVRIDDKDYGDALLTDGNPFTAFESPWTKGHREAVVLIELTQTRDINVMRWQAADANWIWQVDVESSIDGESYWPIESLQAFSMHKKWGQQVFPLPAPVKARFLRLRFYNADGPMNIVRLPKSIEIFDGPQNDVVKMPVAGKRIDSGQLEIALKPGQIRSLPIALKQPLSPGAYLLTWTLSTDPSQSGWSEIFVKPTDVPNKNATRRFGINSSDVQLADLMSQCGFGWVRFENGKWSMSSDARDHYSFSGKIAPWHVDQDAIYRAYRSRKMKVMPYVFQTPEWATSAGTKVTKNRAGYPPKQMSDYGDAVYQFVARFGTQKRPDDSLKTDDRLSGADLIDAIELWNEPNLVGPSWAPFVGSIEQYFEVMRAGVDGARKADPNLTVTSCGWAGIEPETIQQMTRFRYADGKCPLDLIDVINVHFYSGVQEPEVAKEDPNIRKEKSDQPDASYLDQLDELIRWRDQHKPSAKIWMTETGNDVGGPIGLSERKQAAKLPRVTMITLARGIDKVFIYRESGSKPTMHAGAGLVRDDGTLRPSWFTMATMIRQLAGFQGRGERIQHDRSDTWILRWIEGDQSVVAAWTIGAESKLKVSDVIAGQAPKSIVDAFGHSIESSDSDEITLSEFPVYLAY